MGTRSPPRWTEEQLQEWLGRRGTPSATESPPSAAKPKKTRAKKELTLAVEGVAPEKKKRRGVEVQPIINSVKNAVIRVDLDEENGVLSMLFDGAKLLSLNELFSIQQFRKYEAFRYKAQWRRTINQALQQLGPQDWRQVFPAQVKMTLFRRSAKSYDLDSPLTPFKFAIDAMVKHTYWVGGHKRHGVIIDDNRQYVPEMVEASAIGSPAVGIRLERCDKVYVPIEIHPESEWFPSGSA